jgi:hypothetical protein
VGRGVECLLQPAGSVERSGTPHLVDVENRSGDVDIAILADFLEDQRHRKERGEIVGTNRLMGAGMEHRRRR